MKRESICTTFMNMPTLVTERLILRRMDIRDASDMFDYARREEVTKYLLWSPHPSLDYTKNYLRYIGTRYAIGDFYDWAVIDKKSNKMIGTCGFTRFDFSHNSAEIGYVLNPDYHGMGLATEMAERVIRYGFEELPLHRIEAKFIEGNEASLAVMKKLGMTFEGYRRESMIVKGEYKNIGICSILLKEWQKLHINEL